MHDDGISQILLCLGIDIILSINLADYALLHGCTESNSWQSIFLLFSSNIKETTWALQPHLWAIPTPWKKPNDESWQCCTCAAREKRQPELWLCNKWFATTSICNTKTLKQQHKWKLSMLHLCGKRKSLPSGKFGICCLTFLGLKNLYEKGILFLFEISVKKL